MKFNLENSNHRFLVMLLLVDLVFLIIHLIVTNIELGGPFNYRMLSISVDRGYPEVFQYIKMFWVILLLLYLARKRHRFLFISWSLLFFYLLLDDSLEIHERIGEVISAQLPFDTMIGLRAQDFGELIVTAIFAAVLFGIILIAHINSEEPGRRISRTLFKMILALVFFGIFLDMADIVITGNASNSPLDIIENFGEMVVISVITWYMFSLEGQKQTSLLLVPEE
jgi:hypothetical protein